MQKIVKMSNDFLENLKFVRVRVFEKTKTFLGNRKSLHKQELLLKNVGDYAVIF